MLRHFVTITLSFAGLALFPSHADGATIASCNAAFTLCEIPENILLQFPFAVIAGDAVLTDSPSAVSDVFRIFNNVVNTGLGTGLGNTAFLYSADDTSLPATSTYSANVVFLAEDPSGITSYTANGTTFLLGAPEPATLPAASLTIAITLLLAKKRTKSFRGSLSCDSQG